MSRFIIKFKNLTPLHIGTGKENYDFSSSVLHSDTLSSALASLRAQKGKTSDIESFLMSFTVSSAFPYFGEFYLTMFCFPNKNNKNDNTSGVATILSLVENNLNKDIDRYSICSKILSKINNFI